MKYLIALSFVMGFLLLPSLFGISVLTEDSSMKVLYGGIILIMNIVIWFQAMNADETDDENGILIVLGVGSIGLLASIITVININPVIVRHSVYFLYGLLFIIFLVKLVKLLPKKLLSRTKV